jgi:hypothetical protein
MSEKARGKQRAPPTPPRLALPRRSAPPSPRSPAARRGPPSPIHGHDQPGFQSGTEDSQDQVRRTGAGKAAESTSQGSKTVQPPQDLGAGEDPDDPRARLRKRKLSPSQQPGPSHLDLSPPARKPKKARKVPKNVINLPVRPLNTKVSAFDSKVVVEVRELDEQYVSC